MATILSIRIKELRKSQGLTQAELGAKLHKAGSTVRMWELGKSTPDAETLVDLAQLFSVSTDHLLRMDNVNEIAETPKPTPQDKQISKINKSLTHLSPKQLRLVDELLQEISRNSGDE